jgi:hypothetical protein
MSMMAGAWLLWWAILLKHVTHIQENIGVSIFLDVTSSVASGDFTKLLSNTSVMDPITEILLITGITLLFTGILYRQLPLDLIPDCIPCIGKYDNFIAAMVAFFGVMMAAIAVYLQLNFVPHPNSTTTLLRTGQSYIENANEFLASEDEKKWDNMAKQFEIFIGKLQIMFVDAVQYAYQALRNWGQQQQQQSSKG